MRRSAVRCADCRRSIFGVFCTSLCAGSRQKDPPTTLFENLTKGENRGEKENIQNWKNNPARNSEVRTARGSYRA